MNLEYYESDSVVDANMHIEDQTIESALRPKSISQFIGQQRVREQLGLVLSAAKARGGSADHLLFSGPPGLGKTTLAYIVATEMNAPIRITSGPAITHAGDLAAVLSSLTDGEILFIDEIHRIAKPAAELLYVAMEDFRVDVMIGKGPGATAIPLQLPQFTLIGATTRVGLLPNPLRDRFGFTAHLDFYENAELSKVVSRSASLLHLDISQEAADELGGRSRGTPRIANRLLRRVRDYNEVHATGSIDLSQVQKALELYEVDAVGLDRLDRSVLHALVTKYGGGPVGVSTLAMAVGEEIGTVEEVAEPFLVRAGFMVRTPRGRQATAAGWKHLGLEAPDSTLFD